MTKDIHRWDIQQGDYHTSGLFAEGKKAGPKDEAGRKDLRCEICGKKGGQIAATIAFADQGERKPAKTVKSNMAAVI